MCIFIYLHLSFAVLFYDLPIAIAAIDFCLVNTRLITIDSAHGFLSFCVFCDLHPNSLVIQCIFVIVHLTDAYLQRILLPMDFY